MVVSALTAQSNLTPHNPTQRTLYILTGVGGFFYFKVHKIASLPLVPLTELEAVNVLLATIQESPVASLDETYADAELARSKLHSVSRNLQTEGWSFNTETSYTLTPNSEGRIVLPASRLTVDVADDNTLMERGQYLYDMVNRTNILDREITAQIVMFLAFDELPQAARLYVTTKAAREFQDDIHGDRVIYEIKMRDEIDAKATFLTDEAGRADWNLITGSPTVQRVVQKRSS